jgi:hypothetical protein
MESDEGKKAAWGKLNPVEPADPEDPYPSPIVVSGGGGSYARLAVAWPVVDGLGGSSQLRERLDAILVSEPYLSGEIDPHAGAALTTHYEEFFRRLETMSEYPSPVKVVPAGGWSVAIPIPEMVVEGFGGPSRLRQRLASIPPAESHGGGRASQHAVAELTAHCDELLGQIETIINEPGH